MGKINDRFIYIHPTFWFVVVLSILTGMFYHILIIFIIVTWHELGHFFMAKSFNWEIRRITLWIFGGVMETEEHLNKPLNEQFLVTIAGPIQHLLIFLIILLLKQTTLLLPEHLAFAYQYNLLILFFNFLPIWPLDGGKLLSFIFHIVLPFKRAHQYILIFSFMSIFIFLVCMIKWSQALVNVAVLITFLFWENKLEWKRRLYVYQRFLLARMNQHIKEKKMQPLLFISHVKLKSVFEHFYLNKFHPILIRDKQIITSELDCLNYYFKQGQYHATLSDLTQQTKK